MHCHCVIYATDSLPITDGGDVTSDITVNDEYAKYMNTLHSRVTCVFSICMQHPSVDCPRPVLTQSSPRTAYALISMNMVSWGCIAYAEAIGNPHMDAAYKMTNIGTYDPIRLCDILNISTIDGHSGRKLVKLPYMIICDHM